MSHFFLIFGKMAEDSEDIFLKRPRPKGPKEQNIINLIMMIPKQTSSSSNRQCQLLSDI